MINFAIAIFVALASLAAPAFALNKEAAELNLASTLETLDFVGDASICTEDEWVFTASRVNNQSLIELKRARPQLRVVSIQHQLSGKSTQVCAHVRIENRE